MGNRDVEFIDHESEWLLALSYICPHSDWVQASSLRFWRGICFDCGEEFDISNHDIARKSLSDGRRKMDTTRG